MYLLTNLLLRSRALNGRRIQTIVREPCRTDFVDDYDAFCELHFQKADETTVIDDYLLYVLYNGKEPSVEEKFKVNQDYSTERNT